MKALTLRYWPLFAIAAILATIVSMSQYAQSTNQRCQDRTSQMQTAAVTKNDYDKPNKNAADAKCSPIWSRYVTWPEGVGAWAVILTLFVVAWQSIETRRTSESTALSVHAIERQTAQ